MGTTADKLNKLLQTKADIKAAIESKGITQVGEVFGDYASKIRNIAQSGDVVINNQTKSLSVSQNGTQTVTADEGYTGLGSVTIHTEVPSAPADPKTEEKTVSITSNGQTIVEKSPSVDGMSRVTVNVNVPCSGDGSPSAASVDFSTIGFSSVPGFIEGGINYAAKVLAEWDESANNDAKYHAKYMGSIVPSLHSNFAGLQNALLDENRAIVFAGDIDLPNATETDNMFTGCVNLRSVGKITIPKSTSVYQMFSSCGSLEFIQEITFTNCSYLGQCFNVCRKLRYICIKDLGKISQSKNLDLSSCDVLGINNESYPNAKQGLIDSLLTYSFDRASAGFETMTVKLHPDTRAVLTEDEVAQITAKGYTLA